MVPFPPALDNTSGDQLSTIFGIVPRVALIPLYYHPKWWWNDGFLMQQTGAGYTEWLNLGF